MERGRLIMVCCTCTRAETLLKVVLLATWGLPPEKDCMMTSPACVNKQHSKQWAAGARAQSAKLKGARLPVVLNRLWASSSPRPLLVRTRGWWEVSSFSHLIYLRKKHGRRTCGFEPRMKNPSRLDKMCLKTFSDTYFHWLSIYWPARARSSQWATRIL